MLGVLVVLAEENNRQFPNRRHVERFVERADIAGPVTETRHRYPVLASNLRGHCQAIGDRNARPDDSCRHHYPGRGISDMHRSALALAGPGAFSGKLGP